jgi:hypothetical protein
MNNSDVLTAPYIIEPDSENDVYVAGMYIDDGVMKPCYWKKGVLIPLELPFGADDFTIGKIEASNYRVYIVGDYEEAGDAGSRPFYWVIEGNDVLRIAFNLPDGLDSGGASDIARDSNGNLYVSGYYVDSSVIKPCYWVKDGSGSFSFSALNLPDGSDTGEAYTIALSGDGKVYIGGDYRDEGEDKPCYWIIDGTDDSPNPLGIPDGFDEARIFGAAVYGSACYFTGVVAEDGGEYKPWYWTVSGSTGSYPFNLPDGRSYGIAESAVVSGSTVYVAGFFIGDNGESPCYWTISESGNSIIHCLAVPENYPRAEVYDIALSSNGDVYTVGYGIDADGLEYTPCYWKNNDLINLGLDLGGKQASGGGGGAIALMAR